MITDINLTHAADDIARVRELLGGERKYVFIHTFGCQQNEADSEKLLGMAESMGYTHTDDAERADLILINTCAIREHAELKALSMLGRFKAIKKRKPSLIIGICGCMAAEPHRAELLKKDFHYVTFTVEPNMLHKVPSLILKYISDGRRTFLLGEDVGDIVEGIPTTRRMGHRAYVSIMYGCNNFCSYCIVPYVRGRERSRNSSDIIEECRALVRGGIKEITLLGQNVNSYRSDKTFAQLLCAIAEIEGDFIIRFMTSHPKDASDELIDVMAAHSPKIAPYFHLPLQAGSDSVLRAMNRTYTSQRYLELVRKLRTALPDIALSTDVIIGFPGESDDDFDRTLQILRDVHFDNVYAFLYSPREGTRAASMEDQVPREVKDARMARLLAIGDEISYERNARFVGSVCRVLTDSLEHSDERDVYTGRTPENKLVHFTSEREIAIGDFINVNIERAGAYDLFGTAEI